MFMLRRTLFIIVTNWLINYPSVQIVVHNVTSMLYLAYMVSDDLFKTKRRMIVEMGSELLGLFAANVLAQSLRY